MDGPSRRARLLIVGAFPEDPRLVTGGQVADCAALLRSDLPDRVDLRLVDQTEPPLARAAPARIGRALTRAAQVAHVLVGDRPDGALLFASGPLSFVEKSAYAALARGCGVRTVVALRSGRFVDAVSRSTAFRRIAQLLARVPHVHLCQSAEWRELLTRLGVPRERSAVVENWVASPELLAIGAAREYAPADPVRVLFLGRVEVAKGILDLMNAVGLLAAESASRVLVQVAGDGAAAAAAAAAARALRIESEVEMLGWVHGERKLALLREAHAFVLPSHVEGLPNAAVEAMACGLPVIATPVGAIPDVVRPGVNGLLVPRGDPARLAEALGTIAADVALRARLGRGAHAVAASRFGVARAVDRICELAGCDTPGRGGRERREDIP